MVLTMSVLAESARQSNGVEYVTLTGLEHGSDPLLQMIDYTLRPEELQHRGKLGGKLVTIRVESVRAIFSGRPQLSGRLTKVA